MTLEAAEFNFDALLFSMQVELPRSNLKHKLQLLIGRLSGFRVAGNSMTPTLTDGTYVLIAPSKQFLAGDIVLANHPFKKSVKILKRIESITPDGDYFLVGDNKDESADSRSFGAVLAKEVFGKAVCRLQ